MKKIILFLLIIVQFKLILAQIDTLIENKVYQLNRKVEIPITFALASANYYGFQYIKHKPHLTTGEIALLNTENIWTFDRIAVEQNYSSTTHSNAKSASDWGMNISIFLPAILYLDKNIRKDVFNILLLYVETQGINTSLYTYGGAMFTSRKRPFVYYPNETLERKLGIGTQDSFFSGHTSSSATASFFMAKIYIDYHPEIEGKKWLLYAASLIPPAFVGYYRYKSLMHFPSDIYIGIAAGAASGILIPHLHKLKLNKKQNFSILPITGSITGLSVKYKFINT